MYDITLHLNLIHILIYDFLFMYYMNEYILSQTSNATLNSLVDILLNISCFS